MEVTPTEGALKQKVETPVLIPSQTKVKPGAEPMISGRMEPLVTLHTEPMVNEANVIGSKILQPMVQIGYNIVQGPQMKKALPKLPRQEPIQIPVYIQQVPKTPKPEMPVWMSDPALELDMIYQTAFPKSQPHSQKRKQNLTTKSEY